MSHLSIIIPVPDQGGQRRQRARRGSGYMVQIRRARLPTDKIDRDITMGEAVERYLAEYLSGEKGRAESTIVEYRTAHRKWSTPEIGHRRVRDVTEADMDRLFGQMRSAGLSGSRMNSARNLYTPFFRWAKRRGIVRRSPMADFEMPTSIYVEQAHVPPEVERRRTQEGQADEDPQGA